MLSLRLGLKFQPGSNFDIPETDLSESLARRILAEDPRDQGTRTTLASLIAVRKQADEAIAEFDRVLDEDPEQLRGRYQRALELTRRDPASAIAEYLSLIEHPRFEELIGEQPTALRAYHRVATDLMKRGKIAEALVIAHRSLDLVNRSAIAWMAQSIICVRLAVSMKLRRS